MLAGARRAPLPQPAELWPYLGGLIGAVVVVVAARAVPAVGVLVVAVALVGGQVLGALLLGLTGEESAHLPTTLLSAALVMTGVALALRTGPRPAPT